MLLLAKQSVSFLPLILKAGKNIDAFVHESLLVSSYLESLPAFLLPTAGQIDLPLRSVLGLFQFSVVMHSPGAAATE